eukprot:GHVS01030967.1.p1 GENE.GHVS01030967.1~~GHVS01030967.1.p1  ORF type:complete len:293 (-),score=86.17 GHVS01030967.1:121-999(-)
MTTTTTAERRRRAKEASDEILAQQEQPDTNDASSAWAAAAHGGTACEEDASQGYYFIAVHRWAMDAPKEEEECEGDELGNNNKAQNHREGEEATLMFLRRTSCDDSKVESRNAKGGGGYLDVETGDLIAVRNVIGERPQENMGWAFGWRVVENVEEPPPSLRIWRNADARQLSQWGRSKQMQAAAGWVRLGSWAEIVRVEDDMQVVEARDSDNQARREETESEEEDKQPTDEKGVKGRDKSAACQLDDLEEQEKDLEHEQEREREQDLDHEQDLEDEQEREKEQDLQHEREK